MNIYKAIKREKKYLKWFYIIMLIIAILLPFIVLLTDLTSVFYVAYLIFIEVLIFLSLIIKVNYHRLVYTYSNNRLRIRSGLFAKESIIFCDKVVIVHTEKMEDDMEIILITTVNFKNRGLKPITKGFLKKFPKLSGDYIKAKELELEKIFYYQVVKKGGLRKYLLLDIIYKTCVKAAYTEECIQNIKISRGQTLV